MAQTTCLVVRGVLVLVDRNVLAVDAGVFIALRAGVLLPCAYGLFDLFSFVADDKVKPLDLEMAHSSSTVEEGRDVDSPLFDAS